MVELSGKCTKSTDIAQSCVYMKVQLCNCPGQGYVRFTGSSAGFTRRNCRKEGPVILSLLHTLTMAINLKSIIYLTQLFPLHTNVLKSVSDGKRVERYVGKRRETVSTTFNYLNL